MNDDQEYPEHEEETREAILEALSHLPDNVNNHDLITLFVMVLDGYNITMLDAMEILNDTNYTYASHALTQGYDPFRPN
jgi:hypothetical protein